MSEKVAEKSPEIGGQVWVFAIVAIYLSIVLLLLKERGTEKTE